MNIGDDRRFPHARGLSQNLDTRPHGCDDDTKLAVEMLSKKRAFAPGKAPKTALLGGRLWRAVLLSYRELESEQGSAMVELALTFPVLLLMITGIFSFGVYLQQDLQLTDAVNVAGKKLAIARGNTTDPCSLVSTTVANAAPYLTSSSMSFTYSFNGLSFSGTTCSSTSNSTGAAGDLVQGKPVTIKVTYPCSLQVYYANLVPSCYLVSQLTEMIQ